MSLVMVLAHVGRNDDVVEGTFARPPLREDGVLVEERRFCKHPPRIFLSLYV